VDKMRAEFEVWFYSEVDGNGALEDLCWQAWQASRAAVKVELPETCCRAFVFDDHSMDHDEYFEVDDIKQMLNDAGISYE
jgi:hypothetical protein